MSSFKMIISASGLLLAVLAAAADVPTSTKVLMENGHRPISHGWALKGKPHPEERLQLTFAVKQQGLHDLKEALFRVSDPDSPDYGKHLSNEEIQKLTAPDEKHLKVVREFILSHGAVPEAATPNSDFITAEVSVALAEKMLATEYFRFSHESSDLKVSRTVEGYSLPQDVAAALDFVSPTTHLPSVRAKPKQTDTPKLSEPHWGSWNTPTALRQLYNVGSAEGKAANNKQAVTAFLNQDYSKNALHSFWRIWCKNITCGKGDPKLVGDETLGAAGTESMLDIETITGLAGNVESEFWGFKGHSPTGAQNEPFLKWLTLVSSTSDADVPKIFSTSYGEDEKSWSTVAAERLNVEFQKAGARGITLLYAAGDEGANCKGGKFEPEWPSSSPYITAVGGTGPTSSWPNPGGEKAVGLSSGGFSNYWSMPSYQKEAVAKYMSTQQGLPDKKWGYNVSGRAYPDIAAQAVNFWVYTMIPEPGVSGTSCASPTAAAIFSLLNDHRLQGGKSTLGFLNPLIYKNPQAFYDVTTGHSAGACGWGNNGWPAGSGWDAVTGVGTPDYGKLEKIVSKLSAGKQRNDEGETLVV
eukprot:TRINITY_DN5832_c0_g2_i1.p1 TRINITY_DN5832_c0_g2~~TRINITY_DN5832_c0_g2_i1.p1  ORF type:complete len:607 (+),score=132.36 TRINITY_DN5832_c0_g2_i1:73-1821(+)